MNQHTSSQNQINAAKSLMAAKANSNSLLPTINRLNGLQFQNQDKSPPGGWRSPESRLRLNPDWNSNRTW